MDGRTDLEGAHRLEVAEEHRQLVERGLGARVRPEDALRDQLSCGLIG